MIFAGAYCAIRSYMKNATLKGSSYYQSMEYLLRDDAKL